MTGTFAKGQKTPLPAASRGEVESIVRANIYTRLTAVARAARQRAFFRACADGRLSAAMSAHDAGTVDVDWQQQMWTPMSEQNEEQNACSQLEDSDHETHGAVTSAWAACHNGHLQVVQWLGDTVGANLATSDSDRITPFHVTVLRGHASIARYLAGHFREKARSGTTQDDHNRTSEPEALEQSSTVHEQTPASLDPTIGPALELSIPDKHGATPLWSVAHHAALTGELDMLKLMVEELGLAADACRSDTGHCGAPPFWYACMEGGVDVARYLATGPTRAWCD
eukprot:SAG31_NODE_1305_length_8893_cov_7.391176_3_plen_283_part_00